MIKFTAFEDGRKNAMIQREIDNAYRWGFEGDFTSLEEALEEARKLERSREASIIVTYLEEACLLAGISIGEQAPGRIASIVNTYKEKSQLWEHSVK